MNSAPPTDTATLADHIAWVALVVALISAVYARLAVVEARRGNRLSLQPSRHDVYVKLLEFQNLFAGYHAHPSLAQIHEFKTHVLAVSELYFSKELHSDLALFYSMVLEQGQKVEEYNFGIGDNESTVELEKKKFRKIAHRLRSLVDRMKVEASTHGV